MKDKPNYYAILSAEVRYDNNLCPNAKLLYAEITALCNMNGECYASNRYFSNLYGKTKISISNWVRQLIKNEYIKVDYIYKEGSKEILYRYIKIIKGGVKENFKTPVKKSLKNNNTNNNNNIIYNNKGRFKKPLPEELASYCYERKNNVDYLAFYDFYESKNWMVGKNKMKDWKACIRTWERRNKKQTSKIDIQLNEYEKGKNLL